MFENNIVMTVFMTVFLPGNSNTNIPNKFKLEAFRVREVVKIKNRKGTFPKWGGRGVSAKIKKVIITNSEL